MTARREWRRQRVRRMMDISATRWMMYGDFTELQRRSGTGSNQGRRSAGRPTSSVLSGRVSRDVLSDAYANLILDDYDIAAGNQMVVGTDFNRVIA